MADPKVILYDVPNQAGEPFSFNPLKTRLALNYKGIPFETHFLEYPDIEPTLKPTGIEANKTGAPYSVPAIKIIGTGQYMMDSRAIAELLEAQFPPATLNLDGNLKDGTSAVSRIDELEPKYVRAMMAALLPLMKSGAVSARSIAYIEEKHRKTVGMSLDEWCEANSGEEVWSNIESVWKEVAGLLKENNNGPFLLGAEVSYADFYLIAMLHCVKKIGEEMFQRLVALEDVLLELYEAGKKWL